MRLDAESVYARLPVALQQVATSVEGLRIQRSRYDGAFRALLHDYERREAWSQRALEAFRDRRLGAFVLHAATTVPYYRELFAELRLEPAEIRTLDDLGRLPVLSKAEVQAAPDRFVSELGSPGGFLIAHTSGTTGAGLRFRVSHDGEREQWAVWWRYRRRHGIALDTWCGYFAGRSVVPAAQAAPPYWRYNVPGRQVMFSGYHLGPDTAADYLGELQRRRLPWLHGYPSLLTTLASFALDAGVRLPGLRWITTGAESLLDHQRQLLERAFGVAPIEHYGLREAAANASACPRGRLHVDEDFAALELVDGRVIGTNLSNPDMPFLRYDTGDLARWGEPCDCGLPGRVLEAVDGRKEDYVVTKRGARLGRLDHIFKDQVAIREAQIQQARPGHMRVVIVRGDRFGAAEERALRAEIDKRVGDDVDYELVYAPAIERGQAGKLRFVVSSLAGGRIQPPE